MCILQENSFENSELRLYPTPPQTKDVNTLTKTARSILRGMQARAITNKAVLCKCHDIIHLPCMKRRECHMCTLVYLAVVVILVILGCIGLVVYFGYIAVSALRLSSLRDRRHDARIHNRRASYAV